MNFCGSWKENYFVPFLLELQSLLGEKVALDGGREDEDSIDIIFFVITKYVKYVWINLAASNIPNSSTDRIMVSDLYTLI